MNRQNVFAAILITLLVFIGSAFESKSAYADSLDPVTRALSARHEEPSQSQLEGLAGGADALIEKLIELRTNNEIPFVAIRAERMLLRYSDRGNVAALLEQDVNSVKYKGLAQAIALNIDLAPSSEARSRLASAALQRSVHDDSFLPYAKALVESRDSDVSRLARERLK